MDGAAPAEEDFSSLPLQDRLASKQWKARVSAYEELVKTFRTSIAEDAPEFRPYVQNPSTLRSAILDANAVAQEKGIECACAFVEYGGKQAASSSREALVSALQEKGLWGATRAGTKRFAIELCLLLVECEDSADGVLEGGVTGGLKSKQPKAVAGAVSVMKEIVRQFGTKTVNPKPILKVVPTIFAHADKGVRAEGTLLVQELHRWLGPALDPHLSELKPVQVKELTESFANEEKPVQTRFTRSQQRERTLKDAEASLTAGSSDQPGAVEGQASDEQDEQEQPDAYDFADPVSILDRLPPDFYEKLSSSKWKERKEEALDPLLETLKKSPKILDSSYDELVKALAGRMTDANIACVISAAGCIEYLAKGLRSGFSRYKPVTMPAIFERCKEKKQSVTDALAAALDAIFASVSISDIVEDIVTFSKHKNPQVKESTYKFLTRALSTTKIAPNLKTDFKPLSDCLISGMEDTFEPVRNAAAQGLGTLAKIVGDRAMGATYEQLDDIRKTKVKEFAENAQVKCKGALAAPSKPAPTAKATAPTSKPVVAKPPRPVASHTVGEDKENAPIASLPSNVASPGPLKPRAGPPARLLNKAPAAPSAAPKKVAPTAPIVSKPNAAHKATASEPLRYKYAQEDAEAQAETVLPPEIVTDLGNGNWKLRLAAMDSLQGWLDSDGRDTDCELIVRLLSKKPGWKESNFQVYGKMAAQFQAMTENSSSWSRACSALTIGPLTDKLGDIKIKKPAGDALTAYVEKFSLQFVLGHAYEPMTKQKAPKAQADALAWVEQALQDFGIKGLVVRDLIEFLKVGLKSSNANVRSAATKCLVTLRLYVGPDIKTFLQDLNPTLLTTIEAEFDKVNGETPPPPSRTSGDNVDAAGPGSDRQNPATNDALDDLFPRQDIDKLIPHTLVSALSETQWKARKEALEQIQGILEANKRLKPNMGDLGTALKQRLSDSNKMVQGLALDVISRIATGMGKAFDKHVRLFVTGITAVLADAKPNVRAPALQALGAIYDACGLESLVAGMAAALEVSNPVQRKEVATFLTERLSDGAGDVDLSPLVGPTIACLEDRSPEVRKASQALLPSIVAAVGYKNVIDKASALKPASRSTVLPFIEACKNVQATNARSTAAPRATSALASSADSSRPSSAASARVPATAGTLPTKPAIRGLSATNRSIKAPGTATVPASNPTTSVRSFAAPAAASLQSMQRKLATNNALAKSPSIPGKAAHEEPVSLPPFLDGDLDAKRNRAMRETGPLKWQVEGSARPDQVEYLHSQMQGHASLELQELLFSRGHHAERDHMAGLQLLSSALTGLGIPENWNVELPELRIRMIANADLILKYLTVRLADTATTITLQCLDVTESLFSVMVKEGVQLSDYEASAFLPSLVGKLGDGKETIRARIRSVLKTAGSIYPSSKIFTVLLEHGVRSKNARTRAESADELASLLQRQGMSVCQPSKALPVIATLISDRDSACRTAALMALSNAYGLIGDVVFRHIGQLPPKEMTMLEERLKRTATNSPASPRSSLNGAAALTPTRTDSRTERSGDGPTESRIALGRTASGVSRLPATSRRRVSALPVPAHLTDPNNALTTGRNPQTRGTPVNGRMRSISPELPVQQSGGDGEEGSVLNEADPSFEAPFSEVASHVPEVAVDALKAVQKEISADPEGLATQADLLMRAISDSMAFAFHDLRADTPQPTLRLCKHLMQTLSSFFDQKALAMAVSQDALVTLLAELTKRLLETADNWSSEAITSLSKVLNMVLIRIFHNANRTYCFGGLFRILQDSTKGLRELQGSRLASQAKYAELVMKCLWKISKTAKESLEDQSLDAQQLLCDIDRFLQAIPPAEWRRRASDNIPLGDMPLRTVKTILQQVVGTLGDAVFDQLTLVERAESSFVYQYLQRLLNNSKSSEATASEALSRQSSTISMASRITAPSRGPDERQRAAPATKASTPSPARSNDIEMNQALKEIFDKIGNAQESKKGIAELYAFQKAHPEAEARINTWISATGSFFQSYLRRALSNLAAEEAERNPQAGPTSPSEKRASDIPRSPAASPRPSSGAYSSPYARDRLSRISSASSGALGANDQQLDSLKQMFGVTSRANGQ